MTNKIYEYKDDQDWYVGSYSIFGGVRTLTDEDLDFPLFEFAQRFRDEEQGFPISVIVLRYGSLYRLLFFCGRYPQPRNGAKSGSHPTSGSFSLD